jgi:hypothetical protein
MSLCIVFRAAERHGLKRPPRGRINSTLGLVNSFSEKSMRSCFERPRSLKDTLSCLLMCERPSHDGFRIQSSFELGVNALSS